MESWDAVRQVVAYDLENGSPDNSDYLAFLSRLDGCHAAHRDLVTASGLGESAERAVSDAGEVYCDVDCDGPFQDSVFSVPDDSYPMWEFSIQDHCAYIATELVVAHLTEIRVFRDLWRWYRDGHWPCGWEGDWPAGRLIVF